MEKTENDIEKSGNIAATDREPMITMAMVEDIVSCLDDWKNEKGDPVTVSRVMRPFRSTYKSQTEGAKRLDNVIKLHYEHLSAIERAHREDCEEEKREYIKKAQKHKGSAKP